MEDILFPTPNADINNVLQGFVVDIQSILRDQFVGLYLYGSLALGDFDPLTSDIDFIVLTQKEITDHQFTALCELHAHFDQNNSTWGKKIEAAYIPLDAFHHHPTASSLYPQIEKGTVLTRTPLEIGWAFQRYILREYGITVVGPSPHSLIDPVDPLEMRQTAANIIRMWQEQSRYDPSWLEWARIISSQAFIVLTLCRIRYSLQTGSVTSKLAAARWAQAVYGPRWNLLIDRALAGQHNEQESSDDDLSEMLAFLNDSALLCN